MRIEAAPAEAASLLRRIAVEAVEPDPDSVAKLVIAASEAELRNMLSLARIDSTRADSLLSGVAWAKATLEALREDPTDRGAEQALVAWLAQRLEEEV